MIRVANQITLFFRCLFLVGGLIHFILLFNFLFCIGTSLVAQLVKNPPAMQETLVQSLGQEDSLEKG